MTASRKFKAGCIIKFTARIADEGEFRREFMFTRFNISFRIWRFSAYVFPFVKYTEMFKPNIFELLSYVSILWLDEST